MGLFSRKIVVATHDGNFHADDVFACAALSLWAEKNDKKLEIIRTRDGNEMKKADFVIDIGGIYNPDENALDHHQKGGAGIRENGIPYASFGLVWKKYGNEICGSSEIMKNIDQRLVAPVDARDNGINIFKSLIEGVDEYSVRKLIKSFGPTWQDHVSEYNKKFNDALTTARVILKNEISKAKALAEGEMKVLNEIKMQNEPNILMLDKKFQWEDVVSKFKNIKFVVYPAVHDGGNWCAEAGKDDPNDYSSDRIKFPENWRGLSGRNLAKASGVEDAIFCHNNGWLCVAGTKEDALKMAEKVLQIRQN